jgi:uncharacterized membrane-anchored protein
MRIAIICAAFVALAGTALADAPLTPEQQAQEAKVKAILANLHPLHGDVAVPGTNATLHLGTDYRYLPPDQARKVLVDVWHNSPESVSDELGMVLPTDKSQSWAAIVSYTADGYVSDSDAKSTDYGKLIQQAKDEQPEINSQRKAEGLELIDVIGWAQPPYYDQPHHTLVWARELKFGNETDNTLNYDMRALGRGGVLSMNILSNMSNIAEVRMAANKLQNVGTFNPGARYTDYKAGSDKKADYGIAGLVAAGIGVVVAKKLGLIAVGLVFFKKFLALIVAGFAGGAAWLRRLFGGKKDPPAAAPPALPGS